jgi:hypothetical protein
MVDNMLTFVSYEQLRRRFILSVTGVVVGVATTAVGALMLAAGVPEGESPSALEKTPVYAELSVNSDAQDRYADALGPECDIKNLLVVVLSSDSDSYEILASSPDDNCPLALMNVSRDDATIHSCPGGTIDGQNALAPASAPSTSATPQPRGGDEQAACPLVDGSDLDIQIIRYRPSGACLDGTDGGRWSGGTPLTPASRHDHGVECLSRQRAARHSSASRA